MQLKNESNIEERILFYGGKVINNALGAGQRYTELKKIEMISILNFKLTNTTNYITRTKRIGNDDINCKLVNGIEYHFIELPKYRKAKKENNKLSQ